MGYLTLYDVGVGVGCVGIVNLPWIRGSEGSQQGRRGRGKEDAGPVMWVACLSRGQQQGNDCQRATCAST